MGNFLAGLFGGFRSEKRILMLGLDAAGKTTLLYKLKLGDGTLWYTTIQRYDIHILYPYYINSQKRYSPNVLRNVGLCDCVHVVSFFNRWIVVVVLYNA